LRYDDEVTVRVRPLALPELVALVNGWGTRPREVGHRDAPADGADATAVADRLHAVFVAGSPDRARLVTEMLTETGVRPGMALDDGAPAEAWSVASPDGALLASAALALRAHLAAHPDRLGVCADHQCADVYVDASPAGHRRFCSLTCQNRTRVATFRARRRADT
jgi:predicted RNA-binding Zn ribbon-like protein